MPRCRAFRVPKRGHDLAECQDACAIGVGRVAVADGAAESANAGLWARMLVEEFVAVREELAWPGWIAGVQSRFADAVRRPTDAEPLPWYLEGRYDQGAFATFLGLSFGARSWQAVAVGDSCLFQVRDDRVQIVDEYTGRVMPDRSWEHGMHQLIEAKEGCTISARRQTLEKLTYPQFFRRYHHLCGMTGTALEVAGELRAVYGLRVVQIPTNRPQRLTDRGARVFVESGKKWLAVAEAARTAVESGQAVLIGTRSVEASERVSAILRTSGLDHIVLNARQDQGEAEIIARAGQQGRITVATNMAGRGTDIGLTAEVRAAGGLHVILTEYHDSTRIDRQLFGRAARQGDPGSCQSIVALDDDVFVGHGARLLLGCARALVSNGGEVPAAVGWMLRATAQASAERAHSRARRATLMDGRRLARGLGFAGRP